MVDMGLLISVQPSANRHAGGLRFDFYRSPNFPQRAIFDSLDRLKADAKESADFGLSHPRRSRMDVAEHTLAAGGVIAAMLVRHERLPILTGKMEGGGKGIYAPGPPAGRPGLVRFPARAAAVLRFVQEA